MFFKQDIKPRGISAKVPQNISIIHFLLAYLSDSNIKLVFLSHTQKIIMCKSKFTVVEH